MPIKFEVKWERTLGGSKAVVGMYEKLKIRTRFSKRGTGNFWPRREIRTPKRFSRILLEKLGIIQFYTVFELLLKTCVQGKKFRMLGLCHNPCWLLRYPVNVIDWVTVSFNNNLPLIAISDYWFTNKYY